MHICTQSTDHGSRRLLPILRSWNNNGRYSDTQLLRDFVSLSIARLNRIRRKPLSEIFTFTIRTSRRVAVHLRDRARMIFHDIRLSDGQFLGKLKLENPVLLKVEEALRKRDLKEAIAEMVSHMLTRDTPHFYHDRNEGEKIKATLERHFPEIRRKTIERAEEILNHKFRILGKDVKFDRNIDWHSNLLDSRRWPLSFSPNIDYLSAHKAGDIRLPWELNRHQHLVILGKAYWFTKDERYAEEFVNQLSSWVNGNPYKLGINWMEGIEISIRLFSWIWSYYFFLDSKCFDEKVHIEFLKNIYMHANFLEEHLSDRWQINNNHLIAEAAGLALVGTVFPEFKGAERWKNRGISILEREIDTQILRDGVTWEQSTGYHKFVADLYLHVVVLCMKNGMQIPVRVLLRLEQMIDFINCITETDGRIPLVGDEDQARVIKISETSYDDARSTLRIGSVLFDRKDWLSEKSEEAFWLLGKRALTGSWKPVRESCFKIFGDSGYVVMRDSDRFLLFSAGPQNPKHLHSGHRHLDALSFVLEAYGTNFLVDPGTYTYLGDLGWRKYFRSARAHNIVVVDDRDPADIEETFELTGVPIARIHDYASNEEIDYVTASCREQGMIMHFRQILFVRREYWLIVDLLRGNGEHTYDLYFHFDHGLKIQFDGTSQSAMATGSKGSLQIVPLVTPGLNGEILEGEVSPEYGTKVKAPILRYRKHGKPPQIFITVLYPHKNSSPEEGVTQVKVYGKQTERRKERNETCIRIDFGTHTECISFFLDLRKSPQLPIIAKSRC